MRKMENNIPQGTEIITCSEDNNISVVKIYAHGGSRPGAGRPATGRKQRKLQATDEEWVLIKKYADEVRSK